MPKPFVAILMGSESDLLVMQSAGEVLKTLQVEFEFRISSAHRTPAETQLYVEEAEQRGCQVFIAGAGLAAHLAGAVAAHSAKPVIGVPIETGPLKGLDALLSTVQMPSGIPVATVAIGETGAKNAGYLAAQILSVADPALGERIVRERRKNSEKLIAQNNALQDSL